MLEHPNEIWKDVVGYEGFYQVSNIGRVKSLERKYIGRDGIVFVNKERVLTPTKDSKGYLQVKLHVNNTSKCYKVHRLVAVSFFDDFDENKQINHINGIKIDNRVTNLECVTSMENMEHRATVLSRKPRGITKSPCGNWKAGIYYKGSHLHLGTFNSKAEAYKTYFYKFVELRGIEPWDLNEFKTH